MKNSFFKSFFFAVFLSEFKRYRKWYGGVWERWIVDAAGGPHCELWFALDKTTKENNGYRPTPICKGTPQVEDYR